MNAPLVLVRYCPVHVSLLMWRHRRRDQLHLLVLAGRLARAAAMMLPLRRGTCQAAPATVRVGTYVVGAEGDDLLLGHPDIRY